MARAKVVHSDDAVQVVFRGDPRNPEPGTAVVSFPGGHIEVSRCSDGSYYAHLQVTDPGNVIDSRVDYTYAAALQLGTIPAFPHADQVTHIALKVRAAPNQEGIEP